MEWFVGKGGQKSGPFSSEQLKRMAQSGQISPEDLIWRQGLKDWIPARELKGLFSPRAGASGGPVPPGPPGGRQKRAAAPPPSVSQQQPAAFPAASFDDSSPLGFEGAVKGKPELAGFGPRLGAALLDGIFVGLVTCIPGVGIYLLILIAIGASNPQDDATVAAGSLLGSVAGNCCTSLLAILYYALLESSQKQATWGKQICGIQVTDLEGGRISFGRAIGRILAKLFLSGICLIGYIMFFFTEKKQTLHDLLASTLVVKKA
jgi:uncharacterized RDD family membrane protein YckC